MERMRSALALPSPGDYLHHTEAATTEGKTNLTLTPPNPAAAPLNSTWRLRQSRFPECACKETAFSAGGDPREVGRSFLVR